MRSAGAKPLGAPRCRVGDLVAPRERALGSTWWLYDPASDVRAGMIMHTAHSWAGPMLGLVIELAEETRSGIRYALILTRDGLQGWIMDSWTEVIT